jgi:pseudouridylate synthase
MQNRLPPHYRLAVEVAYALSGGKPVVALESTVITHGLPRPENLQLARDMETQVRVGGAVPATVAVLRGVIHVGLDEGQIDQLEGEPDLRKITPRDLAPAIAAGSSGGTTVAATLVAAQAAGIQVFAKGGIGGVHRGGGWDVSADLQQLARNRMVVVCAGAKAILDLPATLEYLETHGVLVAGYQTGEFPAFYSRSSGLLLGVRVEDAGEVARLARLHWELGMPGAVLVAVPPPEEVALSRQAVEHALSQALQDADRAGVWGPAVTPYLLERVNALTGGDSLRANLGLLLNNARVAAEIAGKMPSSRSMPVA